MPLYRCLQCRGEFEAQKPVCEACGIDPAENPRDRDIVVELVPHHFDPPSKREGRGLGYAACDPKLRVGGRGAAGAMFTGDPAHVNCPACRASKAFADAGGRNNGAVAIPVNPLN